MRPDRFDLLFAVAAAAAAVALLSLGAGLTFFSDEWAFIETRSLGDPSTWFTPHNEHWATVPILVYRALVETVGIGSYMPYLGVLISLHLAVAGLVYVLVRRQSGPLVALAVSTVVLLMGGGFENLFWAFQIGFVGSLAAGLAAIAVFDSAPLTARRATLGALLLLVSLASQGGPGIVCSGAVAIELLLDPRRRPMVLLLGFPAAIYSAWYLAIGRVGVESHQGVFRFGGLAEIPPIMFSGFTTVAATLLGVGTDLGGIALIAAAVLTVIWAVRGRLSAVAPRFVACMFAIFVFYALISLARSSVGSDAATLTRYTYVGVVLAVIGLSAQVRRPSMSGAFARRAWLYGGVAILTLSLIWNLRLLIGGRELFADRAERTRALITVALDRPLPATTDPGRSLVLVPSPASLSRIVAQYGSPLHDWLVPGAVRAIRPEVLADARRVLAEGAEIPLPSPRDEAP